MPAIFLLLITLLVACNTSEKTLTIEAQLIPTLQSKGFELYKPEQILETPYEDFVPENQSHWFESDALLLYEATLSPYCYLYTLTYEATHSEQKDTLNNPLHHITHIFKTHVPFPRQQDIKIRYLAQTPMLFEWVSSLALCPSFI